MAESRLPLRLHLDNFPLPSGHLISCLKPAQPLRQDSMAVKAEGSFGLLVQGINVEKTFRSRSASQTRSYELALLDALGILVQKACLSN